MTPIDHLEQIAADAMRRIPTRDHGNRPASCRHMPHAAIGVVCGMHPTRVECLDCARRHVRGHNPELEHTCDRCDAVTPTIAGAAIPWIARYVTADRRGAFLVRVFVGGLGLCPDCAALVDEVAA